MSSLYLIVLMFAICSIAVAIMRSRATKSDQDPVNIEKDKMAEEKYAALCEDDETIKVVCRGYREEYYVLTDKRFIIDNNKGFNSIPLDAIKKVVFKKADGGKARNVEQCQLMIIYADKKYPTARYSAKYDEITSYFFRRYI